MPAASVLQLANFICRFGENQRLLDLPKIVIPAFCDESLVRSHGSTRYLIRNCLLAQENIDGHTIYCLAGRFIKDTYYTREQVYKDGIGLILDKDKLQTSPSALFYLILNNHRLIYVGEKSHAPTLESFRATVYKFLAEKRLQLINNLIQDPYFNKFFLDKFEKKATKKDLLHLIPPPSLEIVPLSSKDSLSDFLARYQRLTKVTIKLLETNHETDSDPLFKALREQKERLKGKTTILEHRNKDGLSTAETVNSLSNISGAGNHEVNFSGIDIHGDSLIGNNKDFSIKVPLQNISPSIEKNLKEVLTTFESLRQSGAINIPEEEHSKPDKLEAYWNYYSGYKKR